MSQMEQEKMQVMKEREEAEQKYLQADQALNEVSKNNGCTFLHLKQNVIIGGRPLARTSCAIIGLKISYVTGSIC